MPSIVHDAVAVKNKTFHCCYFPLGELFAGLGSRRRLGGRLSCRGRLSRRFADDVGGACLGGGL